MNLMQISAIAGLILCALFLAWLLATGIADRIRLRKGLRKAMERDEAYRASWSTWGDVTNLSA
jgi:hypothetical protein